MTKLKKLQASLSNNIIIDTQALNIRGGRRKVYNSLEKALKKMAKLIAKGKTPTMHEHNGTYCIDW